MRSPFFPNPLSHFARPKLTSARNIFHIATLTGLTRDSIGMPQQASTHLLRGRGLSASDPDATPPTTNPPIANFAMPLPANDAQRRKKRVARRVHRPSIDSLYDLLNQHSGTSLFVRPICWTDLHAKVLGAEFIELPACDAPQPSYVVGSPPSKGHMRPSKAITTLSEALTEVMNYRLPSFSHALGSLAVRTVMATLWPEPFKKSTVLCDFNLFFGGRVYRDALRVPAMWNYPAQDSNSTCQSFDSRTTRPAESFNAPDKTNGTTAHCKEGRPMMCYIGKQQLALIRRNLFRISSGPNQTRNEPVYRLQQLRAKALVPGNDDHDSHLIGIFLGMAQRHFYTQPKGPGPRTSKYAPSKGEPLHPTFHDLTLRILSTDVETAEFLVYTGYVTAGFLERFHAPLRVPHLTDEGKVPGIRIEFTRVPIWPILGLKERLGQALGSEIVGPVDVDNVERWEEKEEGKGEDEANGNDSASKRKREALAEVFNSSFEEGSDDEPALSAKKRCLSERSPLGIVI